MVKTTVRALSSLQAGCCGHISELQQLEKPAKETHKGQAACSSPGEEGGREGQGGSPSSARAHSESQPLTVIKNSPRAHCEVPSARTLCSIVNWG